MACQRRRGPLLGAGSQLPFPLRPDESHLAGCHGAGVPARGPTLFLETAAYQIYRYILMSDFRQTPYPQPALGSAIRELRQRRGVSLESVGREAGIAPNTLSLIERGEANPTWHTVRGIAAALDVRLSVLAIAAEKLEK